MQPCDFDAIEREERPQAKRIAEYFLRTLSPQVFPPKQRIIDVGCGPGLYVDELRKLRFDAHGVDNDERLPKEAWFHMVDVTATPDLTSAPLDGHFDVAMSIEVGEHIPEDAAHQYAIFLSATGAHTLYFSAARPGQGGHGHINCQPKAYWTKLLHGVGFYYDPDETDAWMTFMRAGYHMGWLVQNGMVFRKGEQL